MVSGKGGHDTPGRVEEGSGLLGRQKDILPRRCGIACLTDVLLALDDPICGQEQTLLGQEYRGLAWDTCVR